MDDRSELASYLADAVANMKFHWQAPAMLWMRWRKRVINAIETFDRFLFFDHIYIGGGNAKHFPAAKLGANATIVPNTAGILGGIRIWDMDYDS